MAKKDGKRKEPKSAAKRGEVRNALVDWVGNPVSARDSAFWREFQGQSTATGDPVTVDRAMQLSTVWACVRLLAETVSALPIRVYRRLDDGTREVARDHPLWHLLVRAPNPEMTPLRFWRFVVASMVIRGNGYVEKRYIGNRLAALTPLLPQRIAVERDEFDRLKDYVETRRGARRVIMPRDMMHIREFGLDDIVGTQPVVAGAEVLGAAQAAERTAAKFYRGGMSPSGVLTTEGAVLTKAQRELIRDSMQKFQLSESASKLMVLEAGMKYQSITMNPETAQMLQTRAFNVEEICRWFKIPPFMVGHMDKASSWASSVEGQNMMFLTSTLGPVLKNIEQEISRCLIAPHEQDSVYAEFNVEGLLRADSAARAAFYNSALQNGWLNRNEVRELENRRPIPGGDVHTVQSNLMPIDRLGEDRVADQARAAMRAWLGALTSSVSETTEQGAA